MNLGNIDFVVEMGAELTDLSFRGFDYSLPGDQLL